MIEEFPDGTMDLDFKDWTPFMMALSSRLYDLPSKPGVTGLKTHEFGIDRLAKLPLGAVMIGLLLEHTDDFEYCPSDREIVRMGKALVVSYAEFVLIRKKGQDRGPSQSER